MRSHIYQNQPPADGDAEGICLCCMTSGPCKPEVREDSVFWHCRKCGELVDVTREMPEADA